MMEVLESQVKELMQDQTCIEIAGMALLGVLAMGAMIFDGDIGESVMVGVSAGLGALIAHVYHTTKEV